MGGMTEHGLIAESVRVLKLDARLGAFITSCGPLPFRHAHTEDPFQALCRSIIYQQISGSAAASVLARFKTLWPRKTFPAPRDVTRSDPVRLRSSGLSQQKAGYLKDLAAKFLDGTIDPAQFPKMSDEEIIEHVCAVKGVGRWTAQMFLMFTLHRPDVLPTGDLGIQKAFQRVFHLRRLPTPQRMEVLSAPWRGHRTVACFYLWRMLDTKS